MMARSLNFCQSCSYSRTHAKPFSHPAVRTHAVSDTQKFGSVKRTLLLGTALTTIGGLVDCEVASAVGFKKELKKRKLSEEDYKVEDDSGLKTYDLEEGRGRVVAPGDIVVVHFDCIYRGLDVQSSRYARLLGGNRTIAEPFEFVAGQPVRATEAAYADSANALFSGQGGPKPPLALSTAVLGMKAGGKRSVLVDDPTLGYGSKGINELPGDTPFELKVELLEVKATKS